MPADTKSLAISAIKTAKTHEQKNDIDCLQGVEERLEGASLGPQVSEADDVIYQVQDVRLSNSQGTRIKSLDEFVAGCTAAFINTTALFPINKLIFRQIAGGHRPSHAAGQLRDEGLRYLYRGILPPLIQKMTSVSIMFGSYTPYKRWTEQRLSCSSNIMQVALAACLTGTTEAVLTPLERVQMLLQDRAFHGQYRNTWDALIKLRAFGFKEYYRGLSCVLLRNGPSNILFFGLRDEIKKLLADWRKPKTSKLQASSSLYEFAAANSSNQAATSHRPQFDPESYSSGKHNAQSRACRPAKTWDDTVHDFLSGAILGMFISTLFYPLSVTRTRMQTRAPGTEFLSIVKAFNDVYGERDRKFTRLFHGCMINIMRQFVSWGIINCSYEFVLDLIRGVDD